MLPIPNFYPKILFIIVNVEWIWLQDICELVSGKESRLQNLVDQVTKNKTIICKTEA